jgi:hypothetical protein
MKIKFIAPDLAKFSGMYGSIEFVDGVSVEHVTQADVDLYGAISTIEVLGDDFTPEMPYSEAKHLVATMTSLPTLAELQAQAASAVHAMMAPPGADLAPELVAPAVLYTKEQLEAIADKEGIAGLREIGTPLNVRATSISKLIQEIMEAQAPFAPAAQFIEAPAEAVTLTMTDSIVEGEGA